MKTYVAVTTVIFALITVAHIWRGFVEPHMVRAPWYIILTLAAAVLFFWGLRLLWRRPQSL